MEAQESCGRIWRFSGLPLLYFSQIYKIASYPEEIRCLISIHLLDHGNSLRPFCIIQTHFSFLFFLSFFLFHTLIVANCCAHLIVEHINLTNCCIYFWKILGCWCWITMWVFHDPLCRIYMRKVKLMNRKIEIEEISKTTTVKLTFVKKKKKKSTATRLSHAWRRAAENSNYLKYIFLVVCTFRWNLFVTLFY